MKKVFITILFVFFSVVIFSNTLIAKEEVNVQQEIISTVTEFYYENGKADWGEDEFRINNFGKNNLKGTKLFCYKKNHLTKSIYMIGYHFVSAKHANIISGNNFGSTSENVTGQRGYYETERSNIRVYLYPNKQNTISRKSLSSTGANGTFILLNKCEKIDNKISIVNKMYEILKEDKEKYDKKNKL